MALSFNPGDEYDDDTCPVCFGTEAVVLGSLRLGELQVRCRDCGTIYAIQTTDYHEGDD